jgi:hypothetical protein
MAAPTESSWTRERLIAATLLSGLVGLMAEVRWEHREVLKKEPMAWLPVFFCAGMLFVGSASIARWATWGRGLLQAGFLLTAALGLLGLLLHNAEHLDERVLSLVRAWSLPAGSNGGVKVGHGPPILAPGAFLGLGVVGWLVCRREGPAARSRPVARG